MCPYKIDIDDLGFPIIKDNDRIYITNSHHKIKIPVLDENTALFLSIMWGDGCITNNNLAKANYDWSIRIVEDDKLFLQSLLKLIKNIFYIEAHVFHYKVKYEVKFNSKIIYHILNKQFKFPDGEKKDRLHIPLQILKDPSLSKNFLKGLFSTDGCLTLSNNYPRITLSSASFEFIKEVDKLLKKLKFRPNLNVYNRKVGNKLFNIRLNGYEQVRLFYKEINFIGDKLPKLEKTLTAP
jgi:DNA-binding transcriptional regulator WhiA